MGLLGIYPPFKETPVLKTSGFVAKSQCVWRPFRSELPLGLGG